MTSKADNNKTLRILIIDDDEVDCMAVSRALSSSKQDIETREVKSGAEGIQLLKDDIFDCVFLDYLLPDGDGLICLRSIRSEGIDVPVIMLTGHGDEQLATEMMRTGASDYLSKANMKPETLLHSMHNTIRIFKAEQERKTAREELHKSNKKIIDILESIKDAFLAIDKNWCFSYLNEQAEILLNEKRETLIGEDIKSHINDNNSWLWKKLSSAMVNKSHTTCEGFLNPSNNWVEANIYPSAEGISVYIRDISERKQTEERLNYLANYDVLTELPNRMLFIDRLQQSLTRAPWNMRNTAVLFCDLDRFKVINDTLGHNAGDKLLKSVAKRLLNCLRDGDTAARLGGDEFAIILTDLADNRDVTTVAQRIVDTMAEPFNIYDEEFYIGISIGISLFPNDGKNPEMLLKNADTAMYYAKKQGNNNFQFHKHTMQHLPSRTLLLETRLRRAIEREELVLHYQPKIDLKENRVIGVEALVRWQDPETGLVPPAEFLPLAEDTGLILPISTWVLRRASEQTRLWRESGLPVKHIAVNIAHLQFQQSKFTQTIKQIINEAGADVTDLELELTESIVMDDVEATLDKLHDLKNLGVQLSIDDFGTGYSSLVRLKSLPIDILKIDRQFIKNLPGDEEEKAITTAIIALAHSVNLKVIAEGVETKEQAALLTELGCDYAQGFLFCRPLPVDECKTFITQYAAK